MPKTLRIGNAIACEYVAMGSNQKYTLVNTYPGDILVREYPARIPLAFYIEVFPGEAARRVTLKLLQNRQTVVELEAEFEYEPNKVGLIATPQITFKVEKDTEVRVVATVDGRPTILLKKKINRGTF